MEMPERNLKWILVASLIMLFGSFYISLILPGVSVYSANRDAWYYLRITTTLFQILSIGAAGLYIADFARRYTYVGATLFFLVSVILLFIQGLRGFF